jgi:hypothetical protein
MMPLKRLRSAGLTVTVQGRDHLRIIPARLLTPDLRTEALADKPVILAELAVERARERITWEPDPAIRTAAAKAISDAATAADRAIEDDGLERTRRWVVEFAERVIGFLDMGVGPERLW